MNKKVKICLFILDGFGEGEKNISNPLRFANLKNLEYFKRNYPFCLLTASGISVGLHYNEPASCEVGHLTMGIGRTYYQARTKIDLAIESGEFYQNEILKMIFDHCHKYNSRLHLIGLISEGLSSTDSNHILAILNFAKRENFQDVYLHLFSDGLDSSPKSALNLIEKLIKEINNKGYPGKIATLCGRFYALDETKNYTLRTQKAFLLLVEGVGFKTNDFRKFLEERYRDPTFSNDSFLQPVVLDENGIIKDNDAILFFHFENRSIFQLATAFIDENFDIFPRPPRRNLLITSLVKYLNNNYPVVFREQKISVNLTRVLAENGLSQLKLIDVSRTNLFKYYFNGFISEEHPNEVYKLLPPFKETKDDLDKQTDEFFNTLSLIVSEGNFDFIVTNLPVLDIVGHLADFKLAIYFSEKIDTFLGEIIEIFKENNYILILTSDHGNVEKLINPLSGEKDTEHNLNPVPLFIIDERFKRSKTEDEYNFYTKKVRGSLIDIAPTILQLFGLPKPEEFNGESLLRYFS